MALAGFAHAPADARSACIAAIDVRTDPVAEVAACRQLGAPVVLACHRKQLQWWIQRGDGPEEYKTVPTSKVTEFFDRHAKDLAPDTVYRAKTWGRFDSQYQLSFVDLGLMPLVEEEIGQALEELIERNVTALKKRMGWTEITEKQGHWLLQSVFWLVSARILRDKAVPRFVDLDLSDIDGVFERVAEHYGTARINIRGRPERDALRESARTIDNFSNLRLVTTESLAHVYENTLISKETRSALGTHSTPTYLVDYVVGKLAPWIEEIPVNERNVFEPACGHAAFLVSAMRLLTELLPAEKAAPASRRRYLRPRLHGCDKDPFALEIARLSLSLTDIPNPDGWDLQTCDMFEGDLLERRSRTASILLANPPFENFSVEEKQRYKQRGVQLAYINKTAEVLGRTLSHLPNGGVFGVVVPQGLLHSSNATALRELLATKFQVLEICLFPDKVFTFSDMESAVIIGRRGKEKLIAGNTLSYRRVREHDFPRFKLDYAVTSKRSLGQSRFTDADGWNMQIPDLDMVWDWCRRYGKLGDVADIGQGLIYKSRELPAGAVTYSERKFPGAVRGFVHFDRGLLLHELPKGQWMNLDPSVIRRKVHGTVTGSSQVLLNYARVSRGPWRLKALIDSEGHAVTSRFIVIRPRTQKFPLEFLWAVSNSPLANAFAYTHLGKRDNLVGRIRHMPLPQPSKTDVSRIVAAARAFLKVVSPKVLGPQLSPETIRQRLLRMDAEVLRLYNLPPELERQVLDLFSGYQRSGVEISFESYYPQHFKEGISLNEFLAITEDWQSTNERRGELIQKKVARTISPDERAELESLQRLTTILQRLIAPLPLRELEQIRDRLLRE